jgi:hypothetical protein
MTARKQLPDDGTIRTDLCFFEKMICNCKNASKNSNMSQSVIFDAMAKYYEEGRSLLAKDVDAMNEIVLNGSFDLIELLNNASKERMEYHAKLVSNLLKTSYALWSFDDSSANRFKHRLLSGKVDSTILHDCLIVFYRELKNVHHNKTRAADRMFITNAYELLSLLQNKWGTWSIDTTTDAIAFENYSDREHFAILMQKMFQAKSKSDSIFSIQ